MLSDTAAAILAELGQAEKAIGPRASNEFRSTMTDIRILAALAWYYSCRLLAAVSYS